MRHHFWRSMQPNILADDSVVTKANVYKRWAATEQTKIELTIL